MSLPTIDLSTLPSLTDINGGQPMGIFGASPSAQMPGYDDSIVILASFLYETQKA